MATSTQPGVRHSSPHGSNEAVHNLLPGLLSGIAGMVDVIGFLSLGLFTAHVTGNLVVIAALVVRGGPPHVAQVLAVPVFAAAVAAAWLIAKASGRRGPGLIRPLLLVQFLLLSCVLVFSVIYDPLGNRHIGVAAPQSRRIGQAAGQHGPAVAGSPAHGDGVGLV